MRERVRERGESDREREREGREIERDREREGRKERAMMDTNILGKLKAESRFLCCVSEYIWFGDNNAGDKYAKIT